ncbi:hypothetical protein BGZ50_004499 [Haplosporangium sp. Z 11]|nr:hypothetical protein BGZ50_004499 [Haplosporangium sp. Z 11]
MESDREVHLRRHRRCKVVTLATLCTLYRALVRPQGILDAENARSRSSIRALKFQADIADRLLGRHSSLTYIDPHRLLLRVLTTNHINVLECLSKHLKIIDRAQYPETGSCSAQPKYPDLWSAMAHGSRTFAHHIPEDDSLPMAISTPIKANMMISSQIRWCSFQHKSNDEVAIKDHQRYPSPILHEPSALVFKKQHSLDALLGTETTTWCCSTLKSVKGIPQKRTRATMTLPTKEKRIYFTVTIFIYDLTDRLGELL